MDNKLTIALKELDNKINKRFDDLLGVMQTFMHQVDARFNIIEKDIFPILKRVLIDSPIQ